jgi:hypothetical protein
VTQQDLELLQRAINWLCCPTKIKLASNKHFSTHLWPRMLGSMDHRQLQGVSLNRALFLGKLTSHHPKYTLL